MYYSKVSFEVIRKDYKLVYYRTRGGYYYLYTVNKTGYKYPADRISKAAFNAAHIAHLYNTGYIKKEV